MSAASVIWTYAVAPDVAVERTRGRACLVTPTVRMRAEPDDLELLPYLTGTGSSESDLHAHLRSRTRTAGVESRCAAVLFRLDHHGLLVHRLWSRGRALASILPLRPPPEGLPASPPDGLLRLSTSAFARGSADGMSLEAAGSWATLTVHDRGLLPLLHDLAVGRTVKEIAGALRAYDEEAIRAVLALTSWCGLLDPAQGTWTPHDLLFHARTRRGYRRTRLGKTGEADDPPGATAPIAGNGGPPIILQAPDLGRLLEEDPPFAAVAERRRSTRTFGREPLTATQLSEFLFRALRERGGRRPYPSAGSRYPLQTYLAIRACRGLAPGVYAYDAVRHELRPVADASASLDALLDDAASSADMASAPQVLLVLAARYARTSAVYGDLSYSLVLKEVGAMLQASLLAAAAAGLAACPLGCGDSLLFAKLTGLDPAEEVSVGELILGSA